jgi:hypothetical protein
MKLSLRILALFLLIHLSPVLNADDGFRLWFHYFKPDGTELLKTCISNAGTPNISDAFSSLAGTSNIADLNHQDFTIKPSVFNNKKTILNADIEVVDGLFGVIHFLQLLQMHQNIAFINIISYPKISIRMLTQSDKSALSAETGNLYQSTLKKNL